jgi:UDP-N-acetylmuramoyl-L-alanyl-D-glutamate--2,6-diaminopimelate ligase
VSSIEYDSRKIKPGSCFVAIIGEKFDGHDYIQAAIDAGATKIVASEQKKPSLKTFIDNNPELEFFFVADTRAELARLVSLEANEPSKSLNVIGVTGTNGKTTVTHLLQGILSRTSSCAVLGTMGLKKTLDSNYHDLGNTTPQSKEIQNIMKELVAENIEYLTMEVSSHAVDQKRTAYIGFKSFAVTNLTQDHLDYHLTMENYFQAKAAVLKQVSELVVLNADDEYYSRFKQVADELKLKTSSISINNEADYQAKNINYSSSGLSYELHHQGVNLLNVKLQLNGSFNVYNSMFAIVLALNEGLSKESLEKILPDLKPVAGRFELIQSKTSPMCVVDYAHTPDGLENVLKGACDLLKPGARLVCLFGCGGDRDITKRPKMAKIAHELADYIFVTSDNPRTEDPEQIVADILTGIPEMNKVKVIIDRRQAIKDAIESSTVNDIVVIAGKGHEDYQIIGETKIHFDDREEVRAVLNTLGCIK